MLRILGRAKTTCDGVTRREVLKAGSLALLGGLAATKSESVATTKRSSRAKSVILIDLFGGPSHIDMFDLKPEAPPEVRGDFKPIASSLTGLQVCEHLPRLARLMHKTTLIRTVTHGYNSHNPYAVMTGFTGGRDVENYFSKPTDHPGMGAVLQYLGVGRRRDLPGYVMLPAYPGYTQGLRRAGPYGGYLGSQYNPLFSVCDPKFVRTVDTNNLKDFYDPSLLPLGEPTLPQVEGGLTLDALDRRRSLLTQFDEQATALRSSQAAQVMGERQQQAFELLLSKEAREAFDLDREGMRLRERYGRDLFGSSALLARRLVEAGVTFVVIHAESKGNGHWDTHENNFNMLRQWLLPYLDCSVSALITDLSVRGLLDSTLVAVTGDMGRTPKVNGKAGRDHWPQCGFCLFAGGGTKEGYVLGATDKQAAYPKEFPVSPGDLCATIYHSLGVDTEATVPDHNGRPVHICHGGSPIWKVFA